MGCCFACRTTSTFRAEKGIENGLPVERTTINASISRVVSAKTEWQAVLDCAANPDIQIVISNTTEVGLTLVASDAASLYPESFPGKLLHFLMERYRVFNGSLEFGLVIIPTELISDNGIKLKEIVIEFTFLIRALFFILFGYLIEIKDVLNLDNGK